MRWLRAKSSNVQISQNSRMIRPIWVYVKSRTILVHTVRTSMRHEHPASGICNGIIQRDRCESITRRSHSSVLTKVSWLACLAWFSLHCPYNLASLLLACKSFLHLSGGLSSVGFYVWGVNYMRWQITNNPPRVTLLVQMQKFCADAGAEGDNIYMVAPMMG